MILIRKVLISFPALKLLILLLSIITPSCNGKVAVTPTLTSIPTTETFMTASPPTQAPALLEHTPTPKPDVENTPVSVPFFTQDFSKDLSGWEYFYQGISDGLKEPDYSLANGKLIFDLSSINTGLYIIYQDHSYVDIQLTVRAENKGPLSSISLVCGYTEERGWYEFNITSQGLYALRRFDENRIISIIQEGGSQSIRVGQALNDYSVTCSASQSKSLNINGKDIIEVKDFRIPVGRAGIGVWALDRRPIVVEVDYIRFNNP